MGNTLNLCWNPSCAKEAGGGQTGMANRIFGSVSWYIQSPGLLEEIGRHLKPLGRRIAVVADEVVWGIIGPTFDKARGDIDPQHLMFAGENTREEVARLVDGASDSDVVVGAGGGKALDAAKLVAYRLGKPMVSFPTIASTDAPASRISILYTPEGAVDEIVVLPEPPRLVLVDTAVIARAPSRFLVAGMGDGLSTWFEAKACYQAKGKNKHGGRPTLAALAIAERCCRTILENGLRALEAVKRGSVTDALEAVVEANILLSGVGFENGGVALAHAINNGLSALPEFHSAMHGEKVAFGLLVQCLAEGAERDYKRLKQFYTKVGLPLHLGALGYEGQPEDVADRVASHVFTHELDKIANEPVSVTLEGLKEAFLRADSLGRREEGLE